MLSQPPATILSSTNNGSFTVLDWLGVALVALMGQGLILFRILVVPIFTAMYADLVGPLPTATALVSTRWFVPLLAVLPQGILAVGFALWAKLSLGQRRALVVSAFLLALAAIAFGLVSLYLPILSIAGAIKAA